MSSGNYSENFADIANWTANFAGGTGAGPWGSYPITSGGSANDGVRTTKSSATFVTGTAGGVQKGTLNLVFLSTGSGTPSEAVAVDLLLDFTGRTAGTLSFDWAAIDNSSGTRPTSLRVFWSTDGSTFTEITAAQSLNVQSPSSGSITTVALPASFNNSATARLRFYNHAGTVTGSGNRDKISIDNVAVTSTAASPAVTIDNTGTPMAGNVTAGASDMVLFGFRLTPSASVDFTGLTLTKAGTTTSTDLSNFQVVYDADNSGTYNSGDSIVSDTKAIGSTIAFVISGQSGIAAARRYLVIADVAGGATPSRTFTGSIAVAGDVTTTGTESGTAAGNAMTIVAAAFSSASDIIRDATFTEPPNIAYGSYQETDLTSSSLQVGQFTIRDGGGSADADSVSTTLDAITFTVANGANLRRVAIYDGTTERAEVAGGASVVFSGLSGLVAADGGTKTFKVLASFNASVTDNHQLSLTVSSATANSGGSTFAAGHAGAAATDTTSDRNRIEVTATKMVFSTEPTTCTINQDFTAAVQAQDANNNVDLDNAASVTISKASGSGTLSAAGGLTKSLSSGAQTWVDLRMDTAGSFTIHANDGGALTDVTSASITASAGPTTLTAGDIAVIGYNTSGSPDNFAILVLKDLGPGTVFYVNDNEVTSDGDASFTDLSEAEASFTVKAGQTITAGTVIMLPWQAAAVSTSTYDWNNNAGSPGLGNANEEIYIYTAAAIGDLTPTAFIFGTRIGSSTSARPSGLTAGTTWIMPTGSASRYKTTGATYTGTQAALLTAIGNTAANWEATAPGAAGDWTFNVVTLASEPTTHASAVNFNGVGPNGMTVNWTTGNGVNCIVVARAGAAPTGTPTDGMAYTANATYGTGGTALGDGFVVYNGDLETVTLSGLSVGTTYYVKIFEYNGSGATANYYTNGTPGEGSQVTDSAPTLDATPTSASVETTTATLGGNVTAINGDNVTERGIYWSTTDGFTPPGQGTKDSETGTFGAASFTRNVTGLPAGQTVYFKSFAVNGAGTTYSANQGSILMKPSAPTAQEETGASSSGFNANWSAATGATGYRLDVSTVNTFASFVTGYENLDVANVTTYAVTGLNPSSTYYYRVRAVNATGTSGNSGTITANTTATLSIPTLTTPTATGIGDTTATLGATVTADGNAAITSRGTVWGTAANPTGNGAAAGGTALGAFTHARSGLTAGTLIYYRGYAVNGQGTAYSEDGTFYTLSIEPTAHVGSFAAAAASGTSIDLTWTAAAGAHGYLILQRTGANPTGTPADGTGYTVGNTIGDGTVAAIVTPGPATAATISSLTANTVYHFAIVPFAWNGATNGTLNYRTAATVPTANSGTLAALSDVAENEGTTDNIAYASYQEAANLTDVNSVSVFGIRIRDGGAGTDNDTAGTALTAISFTVNDAATLRRAALYDGVTELAEIAVSGSPLVFNGFSATAADGGTKDLTLRVSFTTNVTDNQELDFAVSAVTVAAAGSGFAAADGGAAASDTAGDANKIEVTATKLAFSSVPAGCTVDQPFSATVRALDANDVPDLDNATSVTITKASGAGTLTGGGAQALTAGEGAWAALQISAGGVFTLTASGGSLTDATSAGITAVEGLTAGDVAVIGYDCDGATAPDQLSLLFLNDIPAGTVFFASDDEVTTDGGTTFDTRTECTAVFTAKVAIAAGTVIYNLPWNGTITIDNATYSWSQANGSTPGFGGSGDTVYLYQSANGLYNGTPTFIFGYNNQNGGDTTYRADGLTAGTTWLDMSDNDVNSYKLTATQNGTKSELLTALGTPANWDFQASTAVIPTSGYDFDVLAGAPTTAPANPTFANVGNNQMDVSWASNGDGERVIVVARQGQVPSADPVDATTYTANASYTGGGTAVGGGKVVYLGSGSSVTVTDLTAGQSYYFRVYALNGTDGTDVSGLRENVKTDAYGAASQGTTGGNSLESDIVRHGVFTESENVAYASYQAPDITGAGDSIELARFTIRDGGADLTDSDSLGTSLTAIEFTVANGANLRRVALYDGVTEIAELVGGATVSFSSLSGLVAAEGGTKEFSVRATFLASVTDNAQVQFTVSSAAANPAGSGFTTVTAASSTTGDHNRIEVTATKLVFSTEPGSCAINQNFTVVVQAWDANNNVDTDNAASVAISKASGSGTLSGGGAQNLVAGVKTFSTLQIDTAGTITLSASGGGLVSATSGNVTATGKPLAISGFMANTSGTDSPYEYVQVIALESIDFSVTPVSVVWANNGTATTNGWAHGGDLTYKFDIGSGSLTAGQVAYVGGSGKLLNGSSSADMSGETWLRAIDTSTTGGDGFGNNNSSGVLGNGGDNADGMAIFVGTNITDTAVPIDAVFFGVAVGSALVSTGTDGYVLPDNDLYDGGYLQSNSTVVADPGSGEYVKLTGIYDTVAGAWSVPRTATLVSSPTAIGHLAPGITLSAGGGAAPGIGVPSSAALQTDSAVLGGTITATNGSSVTEWGVYWSPTSAFTPPTQGTKVSQTGARGTGAFALTVGGLGEGQTYYFRAFAVNASGTNYTAESNFTTPTTVFFTPGNLAVLSADFAASNNTTFGILELSPSIADQGIPIHTVAINGTNGPSALRTSGSATSVGYLSDSDNGALLLFTGHNSTDASVNANTILPRGVGSLNSSGNFTLQATHTGTGGQQTRGVATVDNTSFFIGEQDGLYTNGVASAVTNGNYRSVKAFGGTAYIFTASASMTPVNTVSAEGLIAALPGLGLGATSRQDFYLISSGSSGAAYDVLYVLDATTATAGTIFKYSLVSGSWTANGSTATAFGGFGLCAAKSGGGAVLYVTTGTGATAANRVIKLTDTAGYAAAITIDTGANVTLYTGAAGTVMKGIAFVPVTLPAAAPTTPPANPTFANLSGAATVQADVNWATNGDAQQVIVVGRQGAWPGADPGDGTTYTADAAYTGVGSEIGGGKVLYIGSGSSVHVTGLTPGRHLYVRVYGFNGTDAHGASGLRENYKTDSFGAGILSFWTGPVFSFR